MDFVQALGDTSNIPEFAVGGVARAEIIDNCVVRVIMFKSQCAQHGGLHIPSCELVWTIPGWIAARPDLQKIAVEISRRGLDQQVRHGLAAVGLLRH